MTGLRAVVAFEAFGARIRVLASESLADAILLQLPPGARRITSEDYDTTYTVTAQVPQSAAEPIVHELARDGAVIGSSRSLTKIGLAIESDMHFHVARSARGVLFVHAGVVEWRRQAILLPGRSRVGKSSLVLALVRAGATYFSDEFAVIEPQGRILPYPRPLSERREGERPHLHAPEALSAAPADSSVPLGLVAVIRFRDDGLWDPRPLSRAEAMLALFDNTLVAQTDSEFALSVLARALRDADALESERGDAAAAAGELLKTRRPPGT